MTDSARRANLQTIRRFELEQALRFFPASGRVLELGAGAGWQSRLLSERGYEVVAVDVPESRHAEHRTFPVIPYDGARLPFRDVCFDVIFSSNVLEHVRHPKTLELELQRVLKAGGVGIHVVPTTAWRFWTLVTHPIYICRLMIQVIGAIFGRPAKSSVLGRPDETLSKARRHWSAVFWPKRHGESGTAVSELYLFSARGLASVFRRAPLAPGSPDARRLVLYRRPLLSG